MTILRSLLILLITLPSTGWCATLSLASDSWLFKADPNDAGTTNSWWMGPLETTATCKLPGSMTESGLGDEISTSTPWTQAQPRLTELFNDPRLAPYLQPGNTKIPFWLTPDKYYVGAAWYEREFDIPDSWSDQTIHLHLERTHWRTDVWIDGQPIGGRDSVSTPHHYRLPKLSPGLHRLTIRVDNRLQAQVGLNAHSVTDHTQTNWNGIVGDILLRSRPAIYMTNIKVIPNPDENSLLLETVLNKTSDIAQAGQLQVTIKDPGNIAVQTTAIPYQFSSSDKSTTARAEIKLEQPVLRWDEFSPNLYTANLSIVGDDQYFRSTTFGFRDFLTSGTEFAVNGRPTFLRGTLECCIFPLTGYPPTDVGAWRRIMHVIKSHGLNHLRFHSWCPPEAAFVAADEEGVYFSIEVASWAHPGEHPDYDQWLYDETRRIINEFGNHPSFCMLLYGNEPGGNKMVYHNFLKKYVTYWDRQEDRFLVSGGAGWPALAPNQFHILQEPRIQHWGEGLKSRINARAPETTTDYTDYISSFSVPIISHEIGQWCVYPNFEERSKYTGVTRALNFDIFEDLLNKHHMGDQARDFLMASGKLQTLCYKEDIESALRTKGMGGFQLLDLHDFPGQGTALVGVLDPFWDPKGYVTAEEYRSFTGPIVPLARLSKRVFTNDEDLTASIELANYGSKPLNGVAPQWTLNRSTGELLAAGSLPTGDFRVGNDIQLGTISHSLGAITRAERLTLSVSIPGTDARNSWDVWVYPAEVKSEPSGDVLVTSTLDDSAKKRLSQGGKVLLVPAPDSVVGHTSGTVKAGFSSMFWNTAWTGGQAPHTLGILCDPAHPALARFPTEFHTNWQWWNLLHDAPIMIMDALSPQSRPIVQMVPDWTKNNKLGYLHEAAYQGGRLVICTFQLERSDPVTRQMKHSILNYMQSDAFDPRDPLTEEQLNSIIDN